VNLAKEARVLYYHTALGEDIKAKEGGGRERETEENAFIKLFKELTIYYFPVGGLLRFRIQSIFPNVLLLLLKEAFGSPTQNTSKHSEYQQRCSMSGLTRTTVDCGFPNSSHPTEATQKRGSK